MKSIETHKFRRYSTALLAAVGFSALAPAVASASCDVPKALSNIRSHATTGLPFRPGVVHAKGTVIVYDKQNKKDQDVFNPLEVNCGNETLYVGITPNPNKALGTVEPVESKSLNKQLFLTAINSKQTSIKPGLTDGPITEAHPLVKLESIITGAPFGPLQYAFVQPDKQMLASNLIDLEGFEGFDL